jgi:hypothetical protein
VAFDVEDYGRDRPLGFHWQTDFELINRLGLPLTARSQRREVRNAIVTEALLGHEEGRWLSFSLNKSFYARRGRYPGIPYSYTSVRGSIEELEAGGWIEVAKARPGDHVRTGMQSRFRATPKLVAHSAILASARYRLEHGLVLLRDKNGFPVPIPNEAACMVEAWERQIAEINAFLCSVRVATSDPAVIVAGHHWTIGGDKYLITPPVVRRIFRGDLQSGGRFYTALQNILKSARPHLTFDGEPTVEFDFRQNHANLLYDERGFTPPEDAYTLEGSRFTREEGKVGFNVGVNCGGR